MIFRMAALGALAWALGCGGGVAPSAERLHSDCSGASCAPGQSCMTYTGFTGQPLHTCEIPCTTEADCPPGAGLTCGALSEGPAGKICI